MIEYSVEIKSQIGKPLEFRHELLPLIYITIDGYGNIDLVEAYTGARHFLMPKEALALIELLQAVLNWRVDHDPGKDE